LRHSITPGRKEEGNRGNQNIQRLEKGKKKPENAQIGWRQKGKWKLKITATHTSGWKKKNAPVNKKNAGFVRKRGEGRVLTETFACCCMQGESREEGKFKSGHG